MCSWGRRSKESNTKNCTNDGMFPLHKISNPHFPSRQHKLLSFASKDSPYFSSCYMTHHRAPSSPQTPPITMPFSKISIIAILTILLTAPFIIAAPPEPSPSRSPTSAVAATAASSIITPPSSYYLQTRVIGSNIVHHDKDGLYVSNYPTGMKYEKIMNPTLSFSLFSLSLCLFLFLHHVFHQS